MLLIFSFTSPFHLLIHLDSRFLSFIFMWKSFLLFAGKIQRTTARDALCIENIRKHTICDKSFRYVTYTQPVYSCRILSRALFASARRVEQPRRSQVQVLFNLQIFSLQKWTLDILTGCTNRFIIKHIDDVSDHVQRRTSLCSTMKNYLRDTFSRENRTRNLPIQIYLCGSFVINFPTRALHHQMLGCLATIFQKEKSY